MQPPPQGYGPPPGDGYPPPQPPAPKKTSTALIILLILAGFIALGGIGCVTCVLLASQVPKDTAAKSRTKSVPAVAQEEEDAIPVTAAQLIADYKANEIRADGQWKGKFVRVTGTVGDVKRDIMDEPYVVLTSGARFEYPHVRCALMKGQEAMASQLSKGTIVTYEARVSGLFGSVNLKECRFITRR